MFIMMIMMMTESQEKVKPNVAVLFRRRTYFKTRHKCSVHRQKIAQSAKTRTEEYI
jgi:hypothetical protein